MSRHEVRVVLLSPREQQAVVYCVCGEWHRITATSPSMLDLAFSEYRDHGNASSVWEGGGG